MAIPLSSGANYPTPDELRDIFLRAIRYGLKRRGIAANVLPGSEYYKRAVSLAGICAIAIENNRISTTALSPITATGVDLESIAGAFGVLKRPASSSSGGGIVDVSSAVASVAIPQDYFATAPNGLKYKTSAAYPTAADASTVQLVSVSTGAATELQPGTVLTWDSASVGNLLPTIVVDAGGIDGGADADDDETLRTRLIDELSAPPVGENPSHIKQVAEDASSSVEAAFIYSTYNGPSSTTVVITEAGGDRVPSAGVVSGVLAYLTANTSTNSSKDVVVIVPEYVDVVLSASLPLHPLVGGAGGGWVDVTPWPRGENAKVTAYNAGTGTATCDATTSPAVGNAIAFWDPATLAFRHYAVATVGGSSGAYTFTVTGGFGGFSPLSLYVSADAVNLDGYGATYLTQMRGLGPGEMTDAQEYLPRSLRYPTPDISWPYALSSRQTDAIGDAYGEVLSIEYAARFAAGTTTPLTTPTVGAHLINPNLLTLSSFAIRKA